jgi:acetyl esterase/lipase
MGFSAGGHLCGTLGMLYGSEAVADIGSETQIRPDALGLCYPVAVAWGNTHQGSFRNLTGSQDPAVWQQYSLDKLVRADMPPVFLWTTRDDQTVPCRNSLVLAQALEEKGVDFVLHVYRRGRHGLGVANALVYPASAIPENSWDVPGWLESLCRFFRDCGLVIED